MRKTLHGEMSRRRAAWLVFDTIGLLVYLVACCAWLVPLERPAPPTPVPLTVQQAMRMNGPSASDGPSSDRSVVDIVDPQSDSALERL
ncbi:hypothetical protein [Mycobacterium sp. E2733]|uniref:hypothetical protein n=1 Tax=Mycobacterium sp. E2733 TaxID=1834138 RepID=UPI0007FDA399|nr:hypothetical protein [Mycobacterium sp. E2733]OBH91275.1 hypothetical protein A5678_11270 [Mycobacterium sp. E2733]